MRLKQILTLSSLSAASSANLLDHNCCAICENVLELYINPIEILENWPLVTAQLAANKCTCKDVSAYDCDYEKYPMISKNDPTYKVTRRTARVKVVDKTQEDQTEDDKKSSGQVAGLSLGLTLAIGGLW